MDTMLSVTVPAIKMFDPFNLKEFYFAHDRPELFRVSSCGNRSEVALWYLIYRAIIAIICTTALFFEIITDTAHPYWWIYLTNQSFLILTIHLLLEMALTIKAFIKQRGGEKLRSEKKTN